MTDFFALVAHMFTLVASVYCKAIFLTFEILGISSFLWFCHLFHPKTQRRQGQGRKEGRILDDVQGGALCT